MTGANAPRESVYSNGYQVVYYEGPREQPWTVWTVAFPQQTCYFARSKYEALRWAHEHKAGA